MLAEFRKERVVASVFVVDLSGKPEMRKQTAGEELSSRSLSAVRSEENIREIIDLSHGVEPRPLLDKQGTVYYNMTNCLTVLLTVALRKNV